MNWLSAYADNLSSALFWPISAFTVLCVAVVIHGFNVRERHAFGSLEHGDARWRILAATQGAIALWLFYLILAAVPAPNYLTKTIVKHEVQTVEKSVLVTYQAAYVSCVNDMPGNVDSDDKDKRCNARALILTYPGMKRYVTTITRTVQDPYATLFNDCVNSWSVPDGDSKLADGRTVSPSVMRGIRQEQCHQQAMRVRGTPIPAKVTRTVTPVSAEAAG